MKIMMIIAGLSMALSGCIGFSWTSKVDDGAVYVLNREMYIAEEDGLILVMRELNTLSIAQSRERFPQGQNFKKPKR